MSAQYHTDSGIEAANENYRMWNNVCRVGTYSAIVIVAILVVMFFALA